MRKILSFFVIISFFACEEKESTSQISPVQSKTSFSDRLEVKTNRTVSLLPEVRVLAAEWIAYATAQNEVQNLERSTGQEIMGSSNNLMQIMETLQTSIPDTLRSNAVEARANVLYTKSRVLHQLSSKKQKNPDEIFKVAEDLVVEFDNFKLQLNELFLKTPENFEMELDEEFEQSLEPDSTGTIPLFREVDI